MANYGYITVPKRVSVAEAEALICESVRACLPPAWEVKRIGLTWLVALPNTAKEGRAAVEAALADGDDVGFTVELDAPGTMFSFRHSFNNFARWAQGCLEEEMADRFGAGVLYDATDWTMPPGTRVYRSGKTFSEYLSRNYAKPLSDEDAAFLERFRYCVPEGYW